MMGDGIRKRSEGTYTAQVCAELVQQGCDVSVISGTMYSRNNADRLVVHRDGVWLLEFKNVSGAVRLGQKARGKQINKKRPCTYFIVYAVDYTTTRGEVVDPGAGIRWRFGEGTDFTLLQLLVWLRDSARTT